MNLRELCLTQFAQGADFCRWGVASSRTVGLVDASERAGVLARVAVSLAGGAGVALPDSLLLWHLAGERPVAPARPSSDPGQELGDELERLLDELARRRGAHFTPPAVADRVAVMAIDQPGRVADPACGGGAMLLAAGRRLVELGAQRDVVARDLLWGADLDPIAAATTEAAIALWSGTAPAPGHVVAGDTLSDGSAVWPTGAPQDHRAWTPRSGFDAVIGNPPFQGQMARDTVRSPADAARLTERFGGAVAAYVDTAALFLLAGVELARPGGRVALIQPQSTVASRDASGVRAALTERARLVDLWAPTERLFTAKVHVCVPVLQVGSQTGWPSLGAGAVRGRAGVSASDRVWTDRLADARGVPPVDLRPVATVGEMATVVAGFRDEYYGLVPHVREALGDPVAPLVTSGLIDIGTSRWGTRPARFAKRTWDRPEVDLAALRAGDARIGIWVDRVRRPKVLIASQTRLLEAVADVRGTWVPSTPVVSALPHQPEDLARLVALLCSPPASAWAARRAVGTALSARRVPGLGPAGGRHPRAGGPPRLVPGGRAPERR